MRYSVQLFLVTIGILLAGTASAASLEFSVPSAIAPQGNQIKVLLNPAADSINALEGAVTVTGAKIVSVNDGDSIVNLWVTRPTIQSSTVIFSGIVPGGYHGSLATLFSFVLAPDHGEKVSLHFGQVHAFRNDGLGTEITLTTSTAHTVFSDAAPTALPLVDIVPPELFVPFVFKDEQAGNEWMLAFSTVDKGTGVARYEVREGAGDWEVATSPYILHDQSARVELVVRAFDGAGNIQTVVVPRPALDYKKYAIWCILPLVLLVIVFVWRKRSKKTSLSRKH